MKKQKQGRLLCALCLALLLIPLAGMLLAGPSDAVSNERLAAKPRLMRAGKLNPDFLSETADYFAGHFYLRPALLTANSTVQAAVFRESASEDVVLGDGGWLFYADTLEDFQGTNPMTGRALFCAARCCNRMLPDPWFALLLTQRLQPFSIFPKLSGGRTGCAGCLPTPDCLVQWVCG